MSIFKSNFRTKMLKHALNILGSYAYAGTIFQRHDSCLINHDYRKNYHVNHDTRN